MRYLLMQDCLLVSDPAEAKQLALDLSALVFDLSCYVDDTLGVGVLALVDTGEVLDLVGLITNESAECHVHFLKDLETL